MEIWKKEKALICMGFLIFLIFVDSWKNTKILGLWTFSKCRQILDFCGNQEKCQSGGYLEIEEIHDTWENGTFAKLKGSRKFKKNLKTIGEARN